MAGYPVISATSRERALELLVLDHPQVAAICQELGETNGCSFPRLVKMLAPECRVILFQESANGTDILKALAS